MAKSASLRPASRSLMLFAALLLSLLLLASCGVKPGEGGQDSTVQIEVTVAIAANEEKSIEAQEETVAVSEAASVLDATESSAFDAQVEDSEFGSYVSSLVGVAAEGSSGWVYTLNGETVMDSAESCVLTEGDRVEWSYMSW